MNDRSFKDFVRKLEAIGLSNKEAAVYLASLQLGPSSVQRLAAASKLNRTALYPVIDSLQSTGLLTVNVDGMKRLFVAEPPSRLDALLDAKRGLIRNVLPDLEAIYRQFPAGTDQVKHYVGKVGVRTAYTELLEGLEPGDEYFVWCTELAKLKDEG